MTCVLIYLDSFLQEEAVERPRHNKPSLELRKQLEINHKLVTVQVWYKIFVLSMLTTCLCFHRRSSNGSSIVSNVIRRYLFNSMFVKKCLACRNCIFDRAENKVTTCYCWTLQRTEKMILRWGTIWWNQQNVKEKTMYM